MSGLWTCSTRSVGRIVGVGDDLDGDDGGGVEVDDANDEDKTKGR